MNHELAERAVACEHWRWMPGMADKLGWRATDCGHDQIRWAKGLKTLELEAFCDLPDLDDPATLGCLLALVREAWGRRVTFECGPHGEDAYVRIVPPHDERAFGPKFRGPTLAAALVAALEAAP